MEYSTWVLANGPLFFPNFILNAFFIYCMVRPLYGERIKQPLKLLLSSLIASTVAYLMPTFVVFFLKHRTENYKITQLLRLISVFCLSTSISSCVWLNFFYCTQIVPAQRGLFIWIKKNIKRFIFCIWSVEIFCSFFDFVVVLINNFPAYDSGFNDTFTVNTYQYIQMPARDSVELKKMFVILTVMQRLHFYFCAGVMVISSGVTVVYLARHMRHMVENGQSLACSKLSSQVRVTAMGILQGLLYLFFALWHLLRHSL
ncbi:taste receptor type 2 member 40-like [Melanotaenia boesemani]|uniref:taste receptor type 2 member 40-like n=1 Tax=Melanotaenia boesemani TaxID=1250792 RepID=UPI001C0458D9|nr:taste receptor type 2 member 40-like [Melanotaenia boesemani]